MSGATVLALHAAGVAIFVRAVTAQVVVAHAVVDVHERYVGPYVALVGAPEARQHVGRVCGPCRRVGQRLGRRERIEIGAGRRPGLVRAVGAVASVVIDLGGLEDYCRVAYALKGAFGLVELDNCTVPVVSLSSQTQATKSTGVHLCLDSPCFSSWGASNWDSRQSTAGGTSSGGLTLGAHASGRACSTNRG